MIEIKKTLNTSKKMKKKQQRLQNQFRNMEKRKKRK